MTGVGTSYQEILNPRGECPECGVGMEARSLQTHLLGQHIIFRKDQGCYLARIRFVNWVRQESEMFNLFLSNKVSNSKK